MRRAIPLAAAVLVAATLLAACGNNRSGNAGFDVTSKVVKDETTQGCPGVRTGC